MPHALTPPQSKFWGGRHCTWPGHPSINSLPTFIISLLSLPPVNTYLTNNLPLFCFCAALFCAQPPTATRGALSPRVPFLQRDPPWIPGLLLTSRGPVWTALKPFQA